MRDDALRPIQLPAHVWTQPETTAALRERRVGVLFALASKYGASQTRIANVTGMGQAEVSRIMSGDRHVMVIDVLERIAAGLTMPDEQRLTLGLAPRQVFSSGPISHSETPTADSSDEEMDSLRRRNFLGLAGGGVLTSALSGAAEQGALTPLTRLSRVLLNYASTDHTAVAPGLSSLRSSVMGAKEAYQACRYARVVEELPGVIADLDEVRWGSNGEDVRTAHALSAQAHHVAAGMLLKRGDHGLGWVAAERSVQAARLSKDPLTVGSSARILTHAFMSSGPAYHAEAAAVAGDTARKLDSQVARQSPEFLSVYGSLLLRGAIAAARYGSRSHAFELLDEADTAARRLGGDHNHEWSAFGPTNVMLHRVNICVALGDAGTAIDHVRKIDPTSLIVERQASLLIDTSHAFNQWGKFLEAYQALRACEEIAPEEVATRSSARSAVSDLLARAPRSIFPHVRDLAARVGDEE